MIKPQALPLNIILLGDPAAGKATQAGLLRKNYNLYDFDMGQELMRRQKSNKALDRLLKDYNDKGKLTPTAIVRKILDEVIHNTPDKKGILFDGHPKMVGEARLVRKWLNATGRFTPLVIYLSIPLSEIIKRTAGRRGYFAGKYGKRPDDNEKALKNRRAYYRKNIAEVIKFFKSEYTFVEVSGVGTVTAVKTRIDQAVKKYQRSILKNIQSTSKRIRRRTN